MTKRPEALLVSQEALFDIGRHIDESMRGITSWGIPGPLVERLYTIDDDRVRRGTCYDMARVAFELVATHASVSVQHANLLHACRPSEYSHLRMPHFGRRPAPLLSNYHWASSEGYYKIQYQNTVTRRDSYVLTGAFTDIDDHTFYCQDISMPGERGDFSDMVQNPTKMKQYVYFLGGDSVPAAMEQVLRDLGYTFSESPGDMGEHFQKIDYLDESTKKDWPPAR